MKSCVAADPTTPACPTTCPTKPLPPSNYDRRFAKSDVSAMACLQQNHITTSWRRRKLPEFQTTGRSRRMPNARRTPNAKRQTPNAKRQTPNAKRQTPNAKRLPSLQILRESFAQLGPRPKQNAFDGGNGRAHDFRYLLIRHLFIPSQYDRDSLGFR
jgi:hypothetical protein